MSLDVRIWKNRIPYGYDYIPWWNASVLDGKMSRNQMENIWFRSISDTCKVKILLDLTDDLCRHIICLPVEFFLDALRVNESYGDANGALKQFMRSYRYLFYIRRSIGHFGLSMANTVDDLVTVSSPYVNADFLFWLRLHIDVSLLFWIARNDRTDAEQLGNRAREYLKAAHDKLNEQSTALAPTVSSGDLSEGAPLYIDDNTDGISYVLNELAYFVRKYGIDVPKYTWDFRGLGENIIQLLPQPREVYERTTNAIVVQSELYNFDHVNKMLLMSPYYPQELLSKIVQKIAVSQFLDEADCAYVLFNPSLRTVDLMALCDAPHLDNEYIWELLKRRGHSQNRDTKRRKEECRL